MVLVERRAVGRDSVLWLGTVLDRYVQILSLCLLGVLPDKDTCSTYDRRFSDYNE